MISHCGAQWDRLPLLSIRSPWGKIFKLSAACMPPPHLSQLLSHPPFHHTSLPKSDRLGFLFEWVRVFSDIRQEGRNCWKFPLCYVSSTWVNQAHALFREENMWALSELWRSGQLLFCLLERREQVAFLTAELMEHTQTLWGTGQRHLLWARKSPNSTKGSWEKPPETCTLLPSHPVCLSEPCAYSSHLNRTYGVFFPPGISLA